MPHVFNTPLNICFLDSAMSHDHQEILPSILDNALVLLDRELLSAYGFLATQVLSPGSRFSTICLPFLQARIYLCSRWKKWGMTFSRCACWITSTRFSTTHYVPLSLLFSLPSCTTFLPCVRLNPMITLFD